MSELSLNQKRILIVQKDNFKHERYEIKHRIAIGGEGVIWEGVNSKAGTTVALKFYRNKELWEKEQQIIRDIRKKCSNEAIAEKFIALEYSDIYNDLYFTVFDLCKRTLEMHIKEEVTPERVGMELLAILRADILPALTFLEENEICHGDIKASNILLKKRVWVVADFGCSGYVDDEATGGTYLPPEYKKRIGQGKTPRMTHQADAFALGLMIVDILTEFRYWALIVKDPEYINQQVPFELPETLDPSITPKLSALIAKDPLKRITISEFAKSSIFKLMNTKNLKDIGDEKLLSALGKIEERVQKVDSNVKKGMVVLDTKISKINKNLNQFLPAIQENLMQVLSVSGVPNRFVLLPDSSSVMDSFYKKYRLYFLCDHGHHLVKGDDIGYSMIQVTKLGKNLMVIARVLISIAIKNLLGLASGVITDGIDSALGLVEKATAHLSDIVKNPIVNGVKDIGTDVEKLSKGLERLEETISQIKSDELAKYDIQNEDDWVRVFAPIKPILKEFLEGKSPERMGVQACRDKYGTVIWLCKHHASLNVATTSGIAQSESVLAFSVHSHEPESKSQRSSVAHSKNQVAPVNQPTPANGGITPTKGSSGKANATSAGQQSNTNMVQGPPKKLDKIQLPPKRFYQTKRGILILTLIALIIISAAGAGVYIFTSRDGSLNIGGVGTPSNNVIPGATATTTVTSSSAVPPQSPVNPTITRTMTGSTMRTTQPVTGAVMLINNPNFGATTIAATTFRPATTILAANSAASTAIVIGLTMRTTIGTTRTI